MVQHVNIMGFIPYGSDHIMKVLNLFGRGYHKVLDLQDV